MNLVIFSLATAGILVDRTEAQRLWEAGATVLDAIRASGLRERYPQIDPDQNGAGIFGRLVPLDTPLKGGDRVELVRPLAADPKELRRRRLKRR